MFTRTNKGMAGTVIGIVLMLGGLALILFPKEQWTPQREVERPNYVMLHITKKTCRVYGSVCMVLGAGLIWVARWPRWGARRSAIDDFVWSLSQELAKHFENRKYYTVEEVSRVAKESGFNMAYIAYAHAMFCSRADCDTYYGPLHVACTYDGLREVIAQRYLDGAWGFDAATIVRLARPLRDDESVGLSV